jgi:sugar-specific transcriptional regulator TrmB
LIEKKDVTTLVKLGLTINQAKTYLANLKTGTQTAKKIAETAQITIQDIYRTMIKLQELGLVEKQLASPTLYKAKTLKQTVPILLKQKDQEHNDLHKASIELEKKQKYHLPIHPKREEENSRFLVLSGKKNIFTKSNQVIKKAKKSGCISTLWESGSKGSVVFADLIKKALRRHVHFRFIINLPLDQKDNYVKKIVKNYLDNPLYEVRFIERDLSKKHLVFSIWDNNDVLFSLKEAPLGESALLWSNNKQFIELVQDAFEYMWTKAIKN